jgi:hypothetical protein
MQAQQPSPMVGHTLYDAVVCISARMCARQSFESRIPRNAVSPEINQPHHTEGCDDGMGYIRKSEPVFRAQFLQFGHDTVRDTRDACLFTLAEADTDSEQSPNGHFA